MAVIAFRKDDNEQVIYLNPNDVSRIEYGGVRAGFGGKMAKHSVVTMRDGTRWKLRGDEAALAAKINGNDKKARKEQT